MFTSHGQLIYDPQSYKGQKKPADWWVLVECCPDLIAYYRAMLRARGIKLQRPLWGSHISVIRGEEPLFKDAWKKYEGTRIDFTYMPEIDDNRRHWWIDIQSSQLEMIRMELGLSRYPDFGFHLTVGMKG